MFASIRGQLRIAGILPGYHYHNQGAAVVSKLLRKGSISENEYIALTGPDTGEKLLGANVFSFNYGSSRVTFQSTLTKRYFEKMTDWK